VHETIERLLPAMPRRDVIRASLEGRGALIHTRSMEEACGISNRIAPEHLEVSSREPQRWEPLLRHAGAIFLGAYTSESLGDYCAGPNHVLPTSGTARFSSPLGVYDFVKRSSLIEVSAGGAQVLGPIAAELAHGEGLQAHARAAEMRLRQGVAAAVSAPPAFDVRPVDKANHEAVLALQVADGQRHLVAAPDRSLAQVAYEPGGRALALFDGDTVVGMMLLYDARQDDDEPANQLYVWRLLVDARFQQRGYGRRAMQWVVDEARRGRYAEVGLSHVDQPGHAGGFYEKLGFAYTGEMDGVERKMLLKLGGA
jgi:histidinol dehydrogenase